MSQTGKYGGTVGVGIEKDDSYSKSTSTSTNTSGETHFINHTKEHMLSQDGFQPHQLRPNVHQTQEEDSRRNLISQHAVVKLAKDHSDASTFETIKPRVLALICREINANAAAQLGGEESEDDDENTSFASSEGTRLTFEDGSTELTVAYLEKVATYEPERQQQLLDDFGLDSLSGFKISKAFAVEFNLPHSGLGPHIFLNDPTLDGVSKVVLNMVHSHAKKLVADYESTFGMKYTPVLPPVPGTDATQQHGSTQPSAKTAPSTQQSATSSTHSSSTTTPAVQSTSTQQPGGKNQPQQTTATKSTPHTTTSSSPQPSTTTSTTQTPLTHQTTTSSTPNSVTKSTTSSPFRQKSSNQPEYDTHDKTAAYVYRGTTDNRRIPYILGIGTAVPKIGAPQEHVVEAMLGPMKLDSKGEERFRKIGQHSGVETRYSVLDNLGQIFWGKEGVNMDHDEFVDERQAVYKREAVKLSIQSSADAVRDWLGEKVYLNDAQREAKRDEVYKHCEEQHRKYEQEHQKLEKTATNKPADKKTNLPQHLNPNLKSFTEGDAHVVPTTSGDIEEDKAIAQLGKRVLSTFNRTITHIVAITCTGIIVPGLEFHILQALQLPLTTQRLPITFAGCFGAISGLRTASALAAENPAHRVLVVCTELCTLHMQLNDKIDNLIASVLFADGSGSFIVGCAPTPKETPIFSIDALSSFIIPNTVQQMAWEATKSGMVIGLAKEIASEIFNVIGDVVDDMLKYTPDPEYPQHRIHPSKCNMAIHPGGPLIINTIQSVFGLDHIDGSEAKNLSYSHPVAETWKILSQYGNMSSATLVFVWELLRCQINKANKPTPSLAFGPGLSIECALLHYLPPADLDHPKYQNLKQSQQSQQQ